MSKNLASLKEVLCGTGDKEPQTEAVAQLAQELYNTNLLISLIANLQKIDFEVGEKMPSFCTDFMSLKYWLLGAHIEWSGGVRVCMPDLNVYAQSKKKQPCVYQHPVWVVVTVQGKKDVVHLFSNIVRRQIGTRTPTVEYISTHPQILFMLLKG